MDRDQLAQALMTTFLEELEGHIAALNRDLLAWEKASSPARAGELIASLLRTVHSVKGASRAVSLTLVEMACHGLEEVVSRVPRNQPTPPEVYELGFAFADALDDARQRLALKQDLSGSPLEALLPQLNAAAHPPAAPTAPKAEALPPPAPSIPVETPPEAPAAAEALPVRVSAQKLDALLARSGELRVASLRLEGRAELLDALREEMTLLRPQLQGAAEASARRVETRLAQLARELAGDRLALSHAVGGLDEEVRRSRTLPFAEACAGLERAVRDVARGAGKQVRLEVDGGALELDRSLLQGLREPLLHLVRNAVAHGLEGPEERRRAGKPEEGRVTLAARLSGGRVQVSVEDDGRGLDLEAIRAQARARGWEVPEDSAIAARLIFQPGLSTASKVTAVSGRGVGLDVVRSQVESLRGSVDVAFRPGEGTRFVLDVPLTLSTLRVLLVSAGGQRFALPAESVERLLRLAPQEVREVEGRQMWPAEDALIPITSLATVLGLAASPPRARLATVVLTAGHLRAALGVDEVLAEQEVLVRGLGPRVRRARHVSGTAVLPDGRMALLLHPASLVRAAEGRPLTPLFPALSVRKVRQRILLADDSPTTRALEQSLLEAAGYEVLPCADGAEAWERLQNVGADALVSDVEMPRMDGFALTEAVRTSPRFSRLPVVLVTARDLPEDKARGLGVGASAYLVKSTFDQTHLLETLRRLL
ncbi:hybrid sensor histidine kinase/response regulator [Stigmatella aurantiaca]|uniref:histidine kinase n=1 Tax=Stigmatella aurantiaca (strain DW4/3-1) TaxID=378806 RepID=Q091M4_STIAD|nr:response regulator [Stigmatella aurantiaca]ADO68675.1 CheA signal transduction histidine kinase [Stigmatella aurantiaca DW4/3-1]EAU66467.1 CheA4 [Stigmatella aurantiaca DW4/3-1]